MQEVAGMSSDGPTRVTGCQTFQTDKQCQTTLQRGAGDSNESTESRSAAVQVRALDHTNLEQLTAQAVRIFLYRILSLSLTLSALRTKRID